MIDILIASHFTQTSSFAKQRRARAGTSGRLWRLARLQIRRLARRRRRSAASAGRPAPGRGGAPRGAAFHAA